MELTSESQVIRQRTSGGYQRLGLTIIVATLIVIVTITAIYLWQQKWSQIDQIRTQGVGLTRTLAGLGYEQLLPTNGDQGLLSTIFQTQNDSNFAYAAIVDAGNIPLSVAAAPGVIVPPMIWPERPVGWLSERILTSDDGATVIEFFTPLYVEGSIGAYLRLGYFYPQISVSVEQLPFFATVALVIFLLAPLFYLMVRHEVRPLRQASENISDLIDSEQFRNVEIRATGEFSHFLERFNAFVVSAKDRIADLENEQEKLLTSKKLITYSKSRIENVLESIPEAVMILDQSGNISFANRRVETVLGVSHTDVLGGDLSNWCNDVELIEIISKYSEQSSASYLRDTIRLDVGEQKQRKLAVKAYPLFSPSESTEIHGSLVVFRDVTKDDARQRQQSEFVAHVAHELKTPLNTLALYAESLTNDDADDPQNRIESANIMCDEVERLAGLIDNLLSITKIETGDISVDRTRLRLGDFLKDTFDAASRGENARQLSFEIDLPPDLSSIFADKELLRIAVNNLLTNAIKYSRPGGVVSMRCEETEQTVRIFVRDTGIGISEDEQSRIFDRFYRSEDSEARQRSGHGLGLALARDIVQLHHGTINVASTPGEGSEFQIEIWKESSLLKQVI